jgi:myo-inositol-1(or 4)-monophosphatase
MHPTLNIAVKAARKAGSIINRAARDPGSLTVSKKRHNDFVTDVDKAAESIIIAELKHAYPSHAILAEESGSSDPEGSNAEYLWIIDPLDGTTNFIHGFPQYAVSIALMHKGVLSHGVIYDPSKDELFTASRGAGAYLNAKRIRVTRQQKMSESLIGTGFPYRDLAGLDKYLAMMRLVVTQSAGIRRAGSAALDLAYVAAGRLDGFWEMGLAPWDIAAGVLMVQEAGGLVSGFGGEADYMESGDIVGGNPRIFGELLGIVGGTKAQQVAGTTMPGVRTRLTATKPASERPTSSRSGASKPPSGRPRSA